MPLQSARRSGLVDEIINQLRDQIASGEWTVGDRIPTEPELAGQLGVGRNTVREAVRALAHAGLLEIRQGAGTFVRARSELTGPVRRRLARARQRETLEVRRGLEVEAGRLAALRRTETDLTDLDIAVSHREAAWRDGDVEGFIAADVELHRLIVAAAHNELLSELYAEITDALHESLRATLGDRLRPSDYVDHGPLVAAILIGDPGKAAAEAAGFLDELLAQYQGAE
ncbi:MAG: GntR family transcriptional regulator [Streptosporangiales bacterium]|nr:GntR family transcriptional regulator [Streptosporangiales bacterium]